MLRHVQRFPHLLLPSTSAALPHAPTPPPTQSSRRSIWTWRMFRRWQDGAKQELMKAHEERKTRVYGYDGMYLSAEDDNSILNKPRDEMTKEEKGRPSFDFYAKQIGIRYLDWSADAIRRFVAHGDMVKRQYDQRYIAERHLYLGADLAAAHFLVHRGAAVKFVGDDTWYKSDTYGRYSLPGVKVPGLYLEAIDASGTQLMWEGFDNMVDLEHLRLLRLADCPHVDDWIMAKMPQFAASLELLDLTNCSKVSAQGLSALACLKHLRSLRLDNVGQSTARAARDTGKVALMLEECIPSLEVTGVDYDGAARALEADHRLASEPRVVEDAVGNLHAYDDNGHLYNVGGRIEKLLEKSLVDEWDRPVIISNIRRDVPNMPIADLLRLDRLSRHRVKHLLTGSASSVHWDADMEQVLGFNAQLNERRGADTPTFLLPAAQLRARLIADGDEAALAELSPEEVEVRRRLDMGIEERLLTAVEEHVAQRVTMDDKR